MPLGSNGEGGIRTLDTGVHPYDGLGNRLRESTTRDGTTSYESSDPALTVFLTDIFQKHPDLAAVVTAWPELPEAIRAGIVAMVKATEAEKSKPGTGN